MKTNRGYSLVELVITVGIMGMLSAVAVPNYQAYRTNSLQKEGISLLSTLYANMQLSKAQLSFYPVDFVGAGFRPEGEIPYRVHLSKEAAVTSYPDNWYCDANCFHTGRSCTVRRPDGVPANCINGPQVGTTPYRVWIEGATAVETYTVPTSPSAATFDPVGQTTAGPTCDPFVAPDEFTLCAFGNLGGGKDFSFLRMTNEKALTVIRDGR